MPFIARIPGGVSGQVVSAPIELFDVMATTLDLAGIPARHTHFARSLAPQLHGAPGDPTRAVFAEGGYDPREPHCFEGFPARDLFARDAAHIYYPKGRLQQDVPESVCRTAMIRTLDHKLIRRAEGVSELYDLRADPRECRNVLEESEYAATRGDLERQLLDWYLRTADVTPFGENPRGLPT